MKKVILSLLGSTLAFVACQPGGSSSAIVIEGQLPQDAEETKEYIYLVDPMDESIVLDSVQVEGKSFRFQREVVDSLPYAMVYLKDKYSQPLFLEAGTIKVDFDKSWASGTALNDDMLAFGEEIEKESAVSRQKFNGWHEELDALPEGSPQADSIDALISKEVYDLQARHGIITEKALAKHPNDAMGVRLMIDLLMLDIVDDEDIERWKGLVGEYVLADKVVAQRLVKFEAKKKTEVGAIFTDFEGQTATGDKVALSQYVGKGHYTLVDFWASWCGPCRAEFPNLKKIYAKYKPLGVEIVGVAISDRLEDHIKAVKDEAITWPQIINEREAATLYGVNSIPHIILFDPAGKIVARDLRGEEIEQLLEAEKAKNGGKL